MAENIIVGAVRAAAGRVPERVALISGEQKVTYAELEARAALVAFVQPKLGAALSEAALRAGCRERLESIKVPRNFVVLSELPRTVTGKLDKRVLASQVASG